MEFDSYLNFLISILDTKFNIDRDVELLKNNTIKFFISSTSVDERVENIMLLEATQIIEDAKKFGGSLLENYEDYEDGQEEEDEIESEYEDEEEMEEFEEDFEFPEEAGEEEPEIEIYLVFQLEESEVKPEKEIYFIIQFEDSDSLDKFIDKEFF